MTTANVVKQNINNVKIAQIMSFSNNVTSLGKGPGPSGFDTGAGFTGFLILVIISLHNYSAVFTPRTVVGTDRFPPLSEYFPIVVDSD